MARIVVIDDDPTIRMLATAILEPLGHTIIEADEGNSGLEVFKQHQPDLVITDIVMPGCEGIETIRAIRKLDRAVPIIAVSGSGGVGRGGYIEMALSLGANEGVRKPFLPEHLIEAVDRVLAAAKKPGS